MQMIKQDTKKSANTKTKSYWSARKIEDLKIGLKSKSKAHWL